MTGPRAVALAAVLAVPALAAAQMAPVAPSPTPSAAPSAVPSAAPSSTASPSPAPLSNTLKWSTASEVENFGYDVYRADAEDGPWVRINTKPIAGAGTKDEPSFYQYVDTEIDPTRWYFYYVESISLKGVREKFTPVIKAKPKRPLPGASPSASSPAPSAPAAPASPSATTHPPVLASPSPP